MMNTAFGKKSLNKRVTYPARMDRFITPREQLPELCNKMKLAAIARETSTNKMLDTKYLQKKRYASCLVKALGLEPTKPKPFQPGEQLWPCHPRKKSYLTSFSPATSLHPSTNADAAFLELLDWSSDNILVSVLDTKYHMWSWRSQSHVSEGTTEFKINCCKFDPQGQLLVVGSDYKRVEVHDSAQSKCIKKCSCPCQEIIFLMTCSITALDWSPTGNSFITGCSNGMLSAFTRNAKTISCQQVTLNAIFCVKVSPDARYVAAVAINDDEVWIFTWPSLKIFYKLESDWTITALTWHPWRSALLAIGAMTSDTNARVALCEAPAGKVRKQVLGIRNHCVDTMLFSSRTGELVLGLWNRDMESTNLKTQLMIMSDPDTVVDQWSRQPALDRMQTLVFSPDETKLATANETECLIWNFLPEDKGKGKKSCKQFFAIPVYLDEATDGVSYR